MKTVNRIEPRSEKEARKLRVAAYARVSMASELSEHSLAAQISYYSGLIQRNPAWEFAGIYADNGISGTGTKKRAEFNRMLADAEAGRIDIILTKSIQRFARNTVDLLNTVRRLKELGVEVRFEREGIHTLSSCFPSSRPLRKKRAAAFPRASAGRYERNSSRAGRCSTRQPMAIAGKATISS